MKVLVVNKSDSFGGAAELAATEVASLNKLGIQTLFAAANRHSPETIPLRNGTQGFIEKLIDYIDRKRGILYKNLPFSSKRLLKILQKEQPDIVHLHNIHGGYLNLSILSHIARYAHLVWNINDMWPLTAHCSVAGTCTSWTSHCSDCPRLSAYPSLGKDTTKQLFAEKTEQYEQTPFTVVVPSLFMKQQAERSLLLRQKPIVIIPLGVNTTTFSYNPNTSVKPYSVIFVAERPSNPDKGFDIAVQAVVKAAEQINKTIRFTTVTRDKVRVRHPLVNHQSFRYITPERLATLYQTSALFISPTAGESFGLTLIESAACGTPFLAPNNTTIPEHAKKLGLTPVSQRTVEAFTSRIISFFSHPYTSAERQKLAQKTVLHYNQEDTFHKYEALFRGLMTQEVTQ